ncbi:glycosyltransferase family 9 protein [Thiobacter aerophilum]|uniref:Glycosyltransferase family 9 protein n=1 Tax=Thiobacter aerophilum TaxID=3121275 RepID=A0ABV0EEG8_9BURK
MIQTAKIGDFINTTTVLRALREGCPHTRIHALIHPVNEPLARRLDTIDEVLLLPVHGFKGWRGKKWLYQLVAGRFDAVLTLSPNLATFIVPFWARIPHRISVLPDRRKGIARLAWPFLTSGERHLHGRLFRETALRALTGLGINISRDALARANEIPTAAPEALAKAVKVLPDSSATYVGLGLGAGNPMKAWPEHKLLEMVNTLIQRTGVTLVLIGTAQDQPIASALQTKFSSQRIVDTTGQWTLDELPALLSRLALYVGVDSGVTYLADALGVPVIDVMGPADPEDQRPLGANAHIVAANVPCAPCSHTFATPYVCARGDRACLTRLETVSILEPIFRQHGKRYKS